MKLAVFIKNTTFHANYGGMETQNKMLCEGLVEKGFKVTVFAPKKTLTFDTLVENGVNYVFVDCIVPKNNFLNLQKANSWLVKQVNAFKTLHAKEPFDLVISQSSSGLGIIKNKKALNIKVISISHGSKLGEVKTLLQSANSFKDYLRFVLTIPHVFNSFFYTQREFIHGSDKIIAVSSFVKQSIIDETFVADDKVEVIFNGIDANKITKLPKKLPAIFTITFVGRVLKEKGIFVLFEAVKSLISKKYLFKIVIIGEGADLQALKTLVKKFNFESYFLFTGNVKPSEVYEFLLKSTVFVLPSLRIEGLPMTLVEAMFCKLPLIATDSGGNKECVINNVNGLLLKQKSAKELTHAFSTLLDNSVLVKTFGDNSLKLALESFTLDIMLKSYIKVIKQVYEYS